MALPLERWRTCTTAKRSIAGGITTDGGKRSMLGMSRYAKDYIAACRSRVDADLSAYRSLMAAARKETASDQLGCAIDAFEAAFFNNMVLLLDYFFVHRLRGVEGKDGNPLNEVRVLSN